eukprot:g434.t1
MYAALAQKQQIRKEQERKARILAKQQGIVKKHVPTIEEYYKPVREGPLGPIRWWVEVGLMAKACTDHKIFGYFMNAVIILAGILVGLQTYKKLEDSNAIADLDFMILVIFTIEFFLKVLSDPLRPWNYWIGKEWGWNNFDFIIVVSCMPFMPFGNGAAVLRLLRLLRVLKLLRSNPQMRMIIAGLIEGLRGAVFIFLLMFLVFYMYAVFGIMMFQESDPWHFRNFVTTFSSLFRMSTLEDWTDVMYMDYYGCKRYPAGGGTVYVTDEAVLDRGWNLTAVETPCKPQAFPYISYVYFHSFIVIAQLILLSMFIGAMAIAMINTLEDMKNEHRISGRQKQEERKKKKFLKLFHGASERHPQEKLRLRERQKVYQITKALAIGLGGNVDTKFREQEAERMSGEYGKRYVRFALYCRAIAYSSAFSNFIATVIILAGIMIGLITDGRMEENPTIEWTIVYIFMLEALLKIIGELGTPWLYFMDPWNRFDFFIVVVSFMPAVGGLAVIMRLMRLLRVLKLLRVVPTLQVIVITILNSFASITYIAAILVLVFYVFGVAGCIFFAANDPWHFGNIHLAMFSLFRASTAEDWTDIMYINAYGCDKFDGYPYNVYPELCANPTAAWTLSLIFFCIFVFFAGCILLTLFIGIICAEMDSMTEKQRIHEKNCQQVERFQKRFNVPDMEIEAYDKLFRLIQEFKSGVTADVDIVEVKGILLLLETLNEDDGTEPLDEASLEDAFNKFDIDGQGYLDMFEFTCMMHAMQAPKHNAVSGDDITSVTDTSSVTVSTKVAFIDIGMSDIMERVNDHSMSLAEMALNTAKKAATLVEKTAIDGVTTGAQTLQRRASQLLGVADEMSTKLVGEQETAKGGCAWVAAQYTRMGAWLKHTTETERFNSFMLLVVCLAGFIVGVQVGYDLNNDPVLAVFDWVILALFTIECLMKIFAHPWAPWTYLTCPQRYWNLFDLLIVILSMPGVMGSQAAILRLLRLLRVLKIIDKLPALKVIVVGLISGINSCSYIVLLMGIVFYIYACLGVGLFKPNDPWHFGTLALALESLFRSATLEDWTDIWYTNYYGCKSFDHGMYVAMPAGMTTGSDAHGSHFNEAGFLHDSAQVTRADASRYCAAFDGTLNISGAGVCGVGSRCVLLGAADEFTSYGCECIGSRVPDLTADGIFNFTKYVGKAFGKFDSLAEVKAAVGAIPAHSASFPYISSNSQPVAGMASAVASFTCVDADDRYPYMPSLGLISGEHQEMHYCEDLPAPITAVCFMFSFIFVSAFILISLFIGSVLISIIASVEEINETVAEAKHQKHKDNVELLYMDNITLFAIKKKQKVARLIFNAWMARNDKSLEGRLLKEFAKGHLEHVQERARTTAVERESGIKAASTPRARSRAVKEWKQIAKENDMDNIPMNFDQVFVDPYEDMTEAEAEKHTPLRRQYWLFARQCEAVVTEPFFTGFITVCIVLASVMVGVQVAMVKPGEPTPASLSIMDHIVSAVFLLEVVLKVIAEDFKPWNYFFKRDEAGWNRLDFIIVVGSYTPLGSLALLLRMIRLFRVLKLLKVLPQLRMLLMALTSAVSSIFYTCTLMLIFFYVMAIMCIIVFRANDPFHWQNLHVAIMTLFRSATGDDWTDVMYTAQYGCSRYPTFLGACDHPRVFGFFAVAFFMLFYLFGGLVFLNLFIGVVTAGMSSSMEELEVDQEAKERVAMLQELPGDQDLSVKVCAELSSAFTLLDGDGSNRLDVNDVQFAFYLMHLFPSEQQVKEMLSRACKKLCEIQGKEFDDEEEDEFIDRAEWIYMMTDHVLTGFPTSPRCKTRGMSVRDMEIRTSIVLHEMSPATGAGALAAVKASPINGSFTGQNPHFRPSGTDAVAAVATLSAPRSASQQRSAQDAAGRLMDISTRGGSNSRFSGMGGSEGAGTNRSADANNADGTGRSAVEPGSGSGSGIGSSPANPIAAGNKEAAATGMAADELEWAQQHGVLSPTADHGGLRLMSGKQREAAIFAAVESVQGHLHMDEPQEAQGQGQSQDQGRGQSQEQEDGQEQGQGQGQNPFSEDVYYQDRNRTTATGTQNDSSESDSMDEVVLASTKIFI